MFISYVSLGCPKNLADTEQILGNFKEAGLTVKEDPPSDIHLINTCAFIRPAVEESIEEILKAEKLKNEGKIKKLMVMGCLVERYGKAKIKELFPAIDYVFGSFEREKNICLRVTGRKTEGKTRHITTKPYAYLKIGEGCSRRCSFCLIPKLRGRQKSLSIKFIKDQAELLVSSGVMEIILVSQDTASYGKDAGKSLASLVKELKKVEGDVWFRMLYLNPGSLTWDVLDEIGEDERFLRYFDIPIQHASDKILSKMRRGYKRKDIEKLYKTIRDRFEDAVLRTTVMVGFPGEEKKEFDELVSFLKDFPFEYLGGFTYFDEEGTASSRLPGKVSKRTAEKRLELIYDMQAGITEKLLKRFVGKDLKIITNGKGSGRFHGQAPEIDGQVILGSRNLKPGFHRVTIKGVFLHDLIC